MLSITLNPSAGISRSIAGGTTAISFDAVVEETDTSLPFKMVGATIDWNDGSQPEAYPGPNAEQASPMALLGLRRNLGVGTYVITVTARNNRAPVPDTAKAILPVTITLSGRNAAPPRNIFGPVLPRDDGLPNKATWMFDTGSDLQLLQSNLRMLLLTSKGERIMQPSYGTNLRRILFELNVASIETIIQQEIAQAINLFEPRVTITSLQVERRNTEPRSVNVLCQFLSRQNGQPFEINLQFAK